MKLINTKEIKLYFQENIQPIFYISSLPTNLYGIDNWVDNFYYATLSSFHPSKKNYISPYNAFFPLEPIDESTNFLLKNPDIDHAIRKITNSPKFIFLMNNEETIKLAHDYNAEVLMPPHSLFQRLDSKTGILEILNKINIPLIPNLVTELKSIDDIIKIQEFLGKKLIIQGSYGDSGTQTFLIENKEDFDPIKPFLLSTPKNKKLVKCMKYINCQQFAIDVCATQQGTIVGPLIKELIGFPELTPYPYGWCGNELADSSIDIKIREEIIVCAEKIGNYLYQELGYKGCFGIDFLIDKDTNTVYFGELNPRITGCGILTNQLTYPDGVPLFLFHLLEHLKISFHIDINQINDYWKHYNPTQIFSLLVVKNLENKSHLQRINLSGGKWQLNNNEINYLNEEINYLTDLEEKMALMFYGACFHGNTSIGRFIIPHPAIDNQNNLLPLSKHWIDAMKKSIKRNSGEK